MGDVPAMAIRGGAAYLKVADASRRDIMTIDEINENFSLLDEWDDRYRYLIELGRMLPPLPDAARIEANKVQGCASQVWLTTDIERGPSGPVLSFVGDSDAHIVRGLIAILLAIYSRKSASDILATDALALFDKLGLREHLTPQRSNGLKSMVGRIRDDARHALVAAGA
jgi:cysteine desulfuration protein SufE